MGILGKKYQYTKNGRTYEEGSFKQITKTVLGLGLTSALAYASYKYGYSEVASLYNQADALYHSNHQDIMSTLFQTWAGTGFFGILIGGFVEACMSDEAGRDYKFLNFIRNAAILPTIGTGIVLFNEPQATEVFINSLHVLGNVLAQGALGIASSVALITPFMSKKLMDKIEDKFHAIPAFSSLTQKFNDYFEKRQKAQQLKNNHKILSQAQQIEQISSNPTTDINSDILSQMFNTQNALNDLLSHTMNQTQNIASDSSFTKLHNIFEKAQYIVKNASLETIVYRQEVLSLYGSVLPQIMKSYEATFENSTFDEKEVNVQKLNQSLSKIDEHFGRLENVIREQNKTKKNMDFDEALQFADTRYNLEDTQIQKPNSRKMTMNS